MPCGPRYMAYFHAPVICIVTRYMEFPLTFSMHNDKVHENNYYVPFICIVTRYMVQGRNNFYVPLMCIVTR